MKIKNNSILTTTMIVLLCTIAVGCSNVKQKVKLDKNSFTYLTQHVRVTVCGKTPTKGKYCWNGDSKQFSASGSVIKHKENFSYILTAGHFCNVDRTQVIQASVDPAFIDKTFTRLENVEFESFIEVQTAAGVAQRASVVATNSELDICVLKTKRIDVVALKLASNPPAYGSDVWNLASPLGITVPGSVPVLKGVYSGDANLRGLNVSVITDLPATFGCSGSPVLDQNGEIISMIYSTNARFDNLSYGVTLSNLRKFIDKTFVTNKNKVVTSGNTTVEVEEPEYD